VALPPCGLYRTTRALADVGAGRLVYFHNHGNPGPGVYLPSGWSLNQATWQPKGFTLSDPEAQASTLAPLPAEGLYAVREGFFCCPKQCVRFEPGQLVQLGYDGEATPILFVPEWTGKGGLGFPERGTRLEGDALSQLSRLVVARSNDAPRDSFVH
jgi:hypothetical protein